MSDLRDTTPHPPEPDRGSADDDAPDVGIGVSSERVGHAGPGQTSTDGTHWTGPVPEQDPEQEPPEQRPGHPERNPTGLPPVAARPRTDPHG